MVMMGLRLRDGININTIGALCGPVDSWLDFSAVYQCIESGWLRHDQTHQALLRHQTGDYGLITSFLGYSAKSSLFLKMLKKPPLK